MVREEKLIIGNRLFNFDFMNNRIVFKHFRKKELKFDYLKLKNRLVINF